MAKRERLMCEDEQTHFSKEFYKLGDNNYLTDVDQVVLTTENEIYHHYKFESGRPTIKRIVEVKHKFTPYIQKQVKNEEKPSSQTYFFASMCSEINSFRESNETPLVEFYYIVQSEGQYPYYVFDVTENDKGEVKYTYKSKINDFDEYIVEMKK